MAPADLRAEAEAIVARMSLDERVAAVSGRDWWTTVGCARLGVKSVWLSDGPHGLRKCKSSAVVGGGLSLTTEAHCYPTAVTLGSSFDVDLAEAVGEASAPARYRGVVVLGPGVNLKRSPSAGATSTSTIGSCGVLRDEWGFEGLVVSDWWAVRDRVKASPRAWTSRCRRATASAAPLKRAVADGSLPPSAVDACAARVVALALAAASGPGDAPVDDGAARARAARGRGGAVLLKNDGAAARRGRRVAVLGRSPRGRGSRATGLGRQLRPDAPLAALGAYATISHAAGYELTTPRVVDGGFRARRRRARLRDEALALVEGADAVVVVAGLPQAYESECYDRLGLDLPPTRTLIAAVAATRRDVVVVLQNGSPVAMPWVGDVAAVLEIYTTFTYGEIALTPGAGACDPELRVAVANAGAVAGSEVVQLYVSERNPRLRRPLFELKRFAKLFLEPGPAPGETKTATFALDFRCFAYWDSRLEKWRADDGAFDLLVGASSADVRSRATWTVAGATPRSAPPPPDETFFMDARAAAGSILPLTLRSPMRDLAQATWCGRLLLEAIKVLARAAPLMDFGAEVLQGDDLPLLQAFCHEGAMGLPISHLALHTCGKLSEAWLETRLLVAVNEGLLAALRAAAPRAFDATTFAVALAAFSPGQRLAP
ncbi:scopolin beta-glucosidase [Aureococcus anophagefferens]|nr:scopolin beta-glucosidase [Aureococcus anophagefferens]